jgi:hypothetical protein
MKRSLLTALLLMCAVFFGSALSTDATAEPWSIAADLSFNITQNTYSDNWTGGDAGAISWTSLANVIAEKQLSEKFDWRNTARLSFGQTHTQDAQTKNWAEPEKSTDKIDIESVLKMTLGAVVDPYAAFRFESQFLDNSEPRVKRLINPVLLTESAGASRTFYKKDKDELTSRAGLAVRQYIDRVVITIDPDSTETETTVDGGLEWVTDVYYTISPEKLRYEGKLTVYQAFYNSKSDDYKGTEREDYWKAPDVNWENLFTASITSYVQVTFYTQLLYDKEIAKGGRFKETLAMGLTYKIF